MGFESARISDSIKFGDDFELNLRSYELHRAGRSLKLERIPTEILLLLLEHRGRLVSREQIVERIWGTGVFLDTDNGINGAIRKIRQVLKDDPERPRFVQTITGSGYRFIAPVIEPGQERRARALPREFPVAEVAPVIASPVVERVVVPEQPQRFVPQVGSTVENPSPRRWPLFLGLAFLLLVTVS